MTDEPANWCGRADCPACQGYDEGPTFASDCPWLGDDLPDGSIPKDL